MSKVELAAQRKKSVRILIPPRFMERLGVPGSTIRTSLEACQFHGCSFAIVEQLEGPRAKAKDAVSWLWMEPGGYLTPAEAIEIDRAKYTLDVVAGTWEAGRRIQVVRLKTVPLKDAYPSLTVLDRIRSGGLNDGDDPRSASMTFVATRLTRNWRWEVRVRPA